MIRFDDWTIEAEEDFLARQNDNLCQRLDVTGGLPEGYDWVMLMQNGDEMELVPLSPTAEGVGALLTGQQLSRSGHYALQLRGTLSADGVTCRHTNVISAFVPRSLSADLHWPELPTQFTQLEQRLLSLNSHPPMPGENNCWMLWNPETQVYEQSAIPTWSAEGLVRSDEVTAIQTLDLAEYEALAEKDGRTLYLIRG